MFHATLFALLGAMFALFAFSAVRADQFVVAIPAALMGLWMWDLSARSGRAVIRRRRGARPGSEPDGRQ